MKRHPLIKCPTAAFIALLFLVVPCFPQSVCLHDEKRMSDDTLPAITHNNREYVSLSHLCETLDIDWQWDMFSERFTCSYAANTASLVQNNNFYQFNDETFQLVYPPIRSGGNLYLNAENTADIFGALRGKTIVWGNKEKQLTLTGKDFVREAPKPLAVAEKKAPKPEQKKVPDLLKKKSPPATAPDSDLEKTEARIRTIVIDPGHGGKDPGAIGGNGTKEKDVVLAVGLAVRDALQKEPDLTVIMTRSKDKFIPLRQRTQFANDKKADLFISIHANSISGNKKKKSQIKGYKVYFLSQAKNEDDKLAAMIENSVIDLEEGTKKGDYLQNILIDMANNEFLNESQDISILLAESFEQSLSKVNKLHRGVGQANFWVLNGAYMPAVLIETCFISNPVEEKLLKNKKFQKKIGLAIARAVIDFKKKYEAEL